jgi:hypothetical protein
MDPRERAPEPSLRWPAALGGTVDQPVRVALVIAAVLVVQPSRPGAETLAAVAAIALAVAVSSRWRVAAIATGVLLVIGIGLRFAVTTHYGSDVLDVTAAAIKTALAGGNPYGIGYVESRPSGAPFPYGPLALAWYAPVQVDAWRLELLMASAVMTFLAVEGRLVGLAVYATAPTLIVTASDGSNDTSAGALLLLTFVVARRRPMLGAVLLAASIAFKPYAAAWAPAFMVWGGWSVIAVLGLSTLVLWSPVLLVWGVGSFLSSLDLGNRVHHLTYWSLGQLYEEVTHQRASRALFDDLRIVLGTVTAVLTLRLSRSLDGVILAGTAVYLVTLYTGFWGTYAYIGAVAPLLCWRLDDWLGLPARPLLGPALGLDERSPEAGATA